MCLVLAETTNPTSEPDQSLYERGSQGSPPPAVAPWVLHALRGTRGDEGLKTRMIFSHIPKSSRVGWWRKEKGIKRKNTNINQALTMWQAEPPLPRLAGLWALEEGTPSSGQV